MVYTRAGEEEDTGLHVASDTSPGRDVTRDWRAQDPQSWMAGASAQPYPRRAGACPAPQTDTPPLPSWPTALTVQSRSWQCTIVCTTSAAPLPAVLPALGEFRGLPWVQEEIRGHHQGNVPQCHLVAWLLGHHRREEFQEGLGKGQDLPHISAQPGAPHLSQSTTLHNSGALGKVQGLE